MNTLQSRSGFLSQKALLFVSMLSISAPLMLPLVMLGIVRPAHAQSAAIVEGAERRVLPEVLKMLTAAFGFGSAVVGRLPQHTPQYSLTQRQLQLLDGVRYQQYMFYQAYGYPIPLNSQNLGVVMSRVGAYPNEARYIATAMYYFGSR